MERENITSEELKAEIKKVVEGGASKYISINKKRGDILISGKNICITGDVRIETKDLSIDISREIKFERIYFAGDSDGDYSLIDLHEPCKLVFDRCEFRKSQKIYSRFMKTENDAMVRGRFPDAKEQDSAGVEFIGCDINQTIKIIYLQSPEKDSIARLMEPIDDRKLKRCYGKFLSKGCTFQELEINLSDLIGTNRQRDFYMELNKNKKIEKLVVFRNDENGRFKAKFAGGNCIDVMRFRDKYPDVIEWGLKEKISEELDAGYEKPLSEEEEQQLKTTLQQNKQELMKLRKGAVDKGNRLQESIINGHISTCDEQLIALGGDEMWQEKIIMWAGRLLSNHGRSWLRPLGWVVFINAVLALILQSVFGQPYWINFFWDWLSIVIELFNPLTTTSTLLEAVGVGDASPGSGFCYSVASAILILSRIVYAICIYEIVRAARRFTYR